MYYYLLYIFKRGHNFLKLNNVYINYLLFNLDIG